MLKQILRSVVVRPHSTIIDQQNISSISKIAKCPTLYQQRLLSISQVNWKKSKQKREVDSDSDEDKRDSYEDSIVDKNTKIVDLKVTNLRLDGILRAGLGLARNKIELHFYESKIRVNGEKVLKKSESINEGDEIDVIKGPSPTNEKLLTVARVEVINITPKDEHIAVRLRRCKSLLIENYTDSWKP